jgi:hypothetical protein
LELYEGKKREEKLGADEEMLTTTGDQEIRKGRYFQPTGS